MCFKFQEIKKITAKCSLVCIHKFAVRVNLISIFSSSLVTSSILATIVILIILLLFSFKHDDMSVFLCHRPLQALSYWNMDRWSSEYVQLHMLMHVILHRACTNTAWKSTLKADAGRKTGSWTCVSSAPDPTLDRATFASLPVCAPKSVWVDGRTGGIGSNDTGCVQRCNNNFTPILLVFEVGYHQQCCNHHGTYANRLRGDSHAAFWVRRFRLLGFFVGQ